MTAIRLMFRSHRVVLVLLTSAVLAVVMLSGGSAGASNRQTVKCVGTADFCGATVSLTGGASNRIVTVKLTDTNFTRVDLRVIPATSKGSFSVSNASFRLGGSEYRFRLDAVQSNPRHARIILLFAAGTRACPYDHVC